MEFLAWILCAIFTISVPTPSQDKASATPQNAREYYKELHDSGDGWNKGNSFNRVCFGDEHPRSEPADPFTATNTFILVSFWGVSPKTIEVQQYVAGEPETIQTLDRDLGGLGWTHLGELGGRRLRWRFTLSTAGRYHWKFDFPDYPQSSSELALPSDGGMWSHGKCEGIR
jgi:hypothetical protein